MKKITLSVFAIALFAFTNATFAQSNEHKEIRKEVNLEEENGVKTLTIKTTTDGNTTTEIYTGKDADTKLAEMNNEKSEVKKTVIIGDDGTQQLKIEKKVVIREEIEEDEN